MIDKAEILKDIFERNQIRRRAQLPLLDVRETLEDEYLRQVHDEYMDRIVAMAELPRLEQKYIARVWRNAGCSDWRPDSLATIGLRLYVLKVLKRIHRMRTGETEPCYANAMVTYGDGKKR